MEATHTRDAQTLASLSRADGAVRSARSAVPSALRTRAAGRQGSFTPYPRPASGLAARQWAEMGEVVQARADVS
jgi:hypothetical protein